jgi:hypothetical protein
MNEDNKPSQEEWKQFLIGTYAARSPALKGRQRRAVQSGDPAAATRAFQRAEGLEETGDLDEATIHAATTRYGFGARFALGPDRRGEAEEGDLREQRPYFLVPLDEDEDHLRQVRVRIVEYAIDASAEDVVATLRRRDVRDWGVLLRALARAAVTEEGTAEDAAQVKADGDATSTIARRLCKLFTPDTLAQLRVLARSGVSVGQDGRGLRPRLRDVLLAEINDALATGVLEGRTSAAAPPTVKARIARNRRALQAGFPGVFEEAWTRGPVTDIYVLSHGWHRNFFGAVAAYDRLASRLALLLHRERFAEIRHAPPFHPLFLMLHWHSDPGQNGWVDRAGRRSKAAFLENCDRLFERPDAHEERDEPPAERFTAVFEDIFAVFSRMSVPETAALMDEGITRDAATLARRLDRFRLRDAPAAGQADKVASAWAAYHAAHAERPLANQQRGAGRFVPWWKALLDLSGFLVSAVGVVAVLAPVLPRLKNLSVVTKARELSTYWWENTQTLVLQIPGWPEGTVGASLAALAAGSVWVACVLLVAFLWLFLPSLRPAGARRRDGVNPSRLAAFAVLQLVCALPLVLFALATYLTGAIVPNAYYGIMKFFGDRDRRRKLHLRTLFDERIGERDQELTERQYRDLIRERPVVGGGGAVRREVAGNWFRFPRYHLARLARWPVRLLRAGLAPENPGHPLADAADNQFAFWEMQVMGGDAGRRAAHFLARLLTDMATHPAGPHLEAPLVNLETVRVHLMGHSFGGLLVGNLLRHLALDPACAQPTPQAPPQRDENGRLLPVLPAVESVCFLQAAMASTWFEHEETLWRYVRGGVGCIYSAYDTANGFYYPLANNARAAAGFVGFYWVGGNPENADTFVSFKPVVLPPPSHAERRGRKARVTRTAYVPPGIFAALVSPPPLRSLAARVQPGSENFGGLFVNLDASRLIFDGPPGSGGGHGDIYKDDVMHLCWAVTRLGDRLPVHPPTPPGPPSKTQAATSPFAHQPVR